jgi:Terminase large subunit, T4likevirus-type, N-terminal
LTHFSAHQFFYMVSRNRSTCGVRPYIRATCNPDAESWVADFLSWWIDPETGLPVPERAGVLRYFIRVAEKIEWADRPEELTQNHPGPADLPPGIERPRPISVTFVPATVFDNPALLRVNPEYLAWLLSLPTLERERLLGGNWKIRPAAGLYFKREWCAVVDAIPADLDVVRYWDLAATEKTEFNDPDWTVGIKLGRDKNGGYWLLDMVRVRANPGDVERVLLNTATQDGKKGPHRVRSGSRASRQEPGTSPGARPQRLHCGVGSGERRQAYQVWAVQFAMSRRQCDYPARRLERGTVSCPRRVSRSRSRRRGRRLQRRLGNAQSANEELGHI